MLVSIEEESWGWFVGVYRVFTLSLYMLGSSNSAGLQWSSFVALVRYGPGSLLYCLPRAYLPFGQFFETETESPSFVSFLLIKEFSSWERHPVYCTKICIWLEIFIFYVCCSSVAIMFHILFWEQGVLDFGKSGYRIRDDLLVVPLNFSTPMAVSLKSISCLYVFFLPV
jgi:hypothetical protein